MSSIKDEQKLIYDFFAPIMIGKLRANRFKKHWEDETIENLLKRIDEEVVELKDMVARGHKSKIVFEAADVALFCSMLAYLVSKPESEPKN